MVGAARVPQLPQPAAPAAVSPPLAPSPVAQPGPLHVPAVFPPPTPHAAPPPASGALFHSDLPFETVLTEARTKGRPVLMYFETTRCGWCDRLKRDTFSQPQVRSRLGTGFVTVRYDAGHAPGSELARRYVMPGYPVIVITDASGTELGRVVGYREAHALLGELARY